MIKIKIFKKDIKLGTDSYFLINITEYLFQTNNLYNIEGYYLRHPGQSQNEKGESSLAPLLFNILLEVLANAIRFAKEARNWSDYSLMVILLLTLRNQSPKNIFKRIIKEPIVL